MIANVRGASRLAVAMPEVVRTTTQIRGTVMAGALLATGLAVAVGIFIGWKDQTPSGGDAGHR